MAENFYEMYLEEMELIRPLDQEEEKRVLAAAARADKEAGNRLVEGNLARALAVAKEYEGKRASNFRSCPGGQYGSYDGCHRV